MALISMPFLVLNMGGEMVYILEQRLRTRCVSPDKARKVLNDVVSALFRPNFIQELLTPQQPYSMNSLRQVFTRLAHSSIMRLSDQSMEKLFDLMAMGFKLQVLTVTKPKDFMALTNEHVNQIKKIISSPEIKVYVNEAMKRLEDCVSSLSDGDWIELRRALVNFYLKKRVKVSLLLQVQLQQDDGRLVLPPPDLLRNKSGLQLDKVGTFKTYENGGNVSDTSERVVFMPSQIAIERTHPVALGSNIYALNLPQPRLDTNAAGHARSETQIDQGSESGSADRVLTGIPDASDCLIATNKLNTLANLIGNPNKSGSASTNNNFRINLFASALENENFGVTGGGSPRGTPTSRSTGGDTKFAAMLAEEAHDVMINETNRGESSELAGIMESMTVLDTEGERSKSSPQDEEEDDLLALMDSAV